MVEPTDLGALIARSPDRASRPELDATDRRILALLSEDGRMPIRVVAERAGISRAGAYARLGRLRASGIIVGYGVRLDLGRMGLGVTAHVFVTLDQRHWVETLRRLRTIPEVVYCAAVAADHDVFLIVRAASVPAVRRLVLEQLQPLPAVQRTKTLIVLEEEDRNDVEVLTILDVADAASTTSGPEAEPAVATRAGRPWPGRGVGEPEPLRR